VDLIVITGGQGRRQRARRDARRRAALPAQPFSFPVARDKLLSYAQMRARLGALRDA